MEGGGGTGGCAPAGPGGAPSQLQVGSPEAGTGAAHGDELWHAVHSWQVVVARAQHADDGQIL